jgi:hypothetical protein
MVGGAGPVTGGGWLSHFLADEAGTMKEPRTSSRDWFTLIIAFFVFIVLVGVIWSVYLVQFEDNPPVVFNKITITQDESVPGGHVEYEVDFCKFTDAAPDRRRFWVNGISTEIPQPDDPPSNPPGCYVFPIKVDVPIELFPKDDYYIIQSFTFQVNPLKERTVSHKIGPFVIADPEQ